MALRRHCCAAERDHGLEAAAGADGGQLAGIAHCNHLGAGDLGRLQERDQGGVVGEVGGRRVVVGLVVAAFAVAALAGCGSSGSAGSSADQAAAPAPAAEAARQAEVRPEPKIDRSQYVAVTTEEALDQWIGVAQAQADGSHELVVAVEQVGMAAADGEAVVALAQQDLGDLFLGDAVLQRALEGPLTGLRFSS